MELDFFRIVSSLLGGIALLGYSMAKMSGSLKAAFGPQLRDAIRAACSNRLMAFTTGTLSTALLSSATATSLLTLEFVESGAMTFGQSLGVLLGINVGSTLNAHLVAFQLHRYAFLLIVVGYFGASAIRSEQWKQICHAIFGLGLLFLSMGVMSDGIAPLKSYKPFTDALATFSYPVLALLASGIAAVALQSSNTVIAIAIMLGQKGLLDLQVALLFVMGANVGTCFTSVIAAFGKKRVAMQVAVAYLFFKTIGVACLLPFMPIFAEALRILSSAEEERHFATATAAAAAAAAASSGVEDDVALRLNASRSVIPSKIANAHTLVNVFVALIFLPFLERVDQLITSYLVPNTNEASGESPPAEATGLEAKRTKPSKRGQSEETKKSS